MYPRLKVRALAEPAAITKEEDKSCAMRAVDFISPETHLPRILVPNHGNRSENVSHPPHAKSKPKVMLTPHIAASKEKKNSKSKEDNKDNKTKTNGLSKGDNCQYHSNLPHAGIKESHSKNSSPTSTASSKGNNNGVFDEENKTNIRATSVPPPRAVLSSPDNDGIIGSRNQESRLKQTPLRRQTLKTNGMTSQQNQLFGEKRTTITVRQTPSPKTEAGTKLGSKKPENPHKGKILKGAVNNSIEKGKRLPDLSATRQTAI